MARQSRWCRLFHRGKKCNVTATVALLEGGLGTSLGGSLGGSWEGLGAVLGGLGAVLGGSWGLLGRSKIDQKIDPKLDSKTGRFATEKSGPNTTPVMVSELDEP